MNRASRVFGSNSAELERHLTQFVGTPMFVSELPEDFHPEAARLLHNYLAALATLRDVQRGVHRKLWPDRYAPDSKDGKRTTWEVEVWTPKINELLGDPATVFLVDLRNYSLHYAIPVMSAGTSFESVNGAPGGPMAMQNTVSVVRAELLKWDGWKSKGGEYIKSQPSDSIDILTPIAGYSLRAREFYGWFWEQVENEVRVEVDEYRNKSLEYGYWAGIGEAIAPHGPDGRSAFRRARAEARRERAAFGTSGWRDIVRDANGEWVVGERNPGWPPLPAD